MLCDIISGNVSCSSEDLEANFDCHLSGNEIFAGSKGNCGELLDFKLYNISITLMRKEGYREEYYHYYDKNCDNDDKDGDDDGDGDDDDDDDDDDEGNDDDEYEYDDSIYNVGFKQHSMRLKPVRLKTVDGASNFKTGSRELICPENLSISSKY